MKKPTYICFCKNLNFLLVVQITSKQITYFSYSIKASLLLICILGFQFLPAQIPATTQIEKVNFTTDNCEQQAQVFTENKGQVWDFDRKPSKEVRFVVENKGMQLFLMEKGIAYQFTKIHYPEGYLEAISDKTGIAEDFEKMLELEKQIRNETFRMNMELEGANSNVRISKEGRSEDYIQYYNRNVLGVHSYSKITYHEIYEGIDWVLYTQGGELKYDFVVRAGADPGQIKLKFTHHENLTLNPDGSLTLSNRMGTVSEKPPVSFQEGRKIATQFVLEDYVVTFKLGDYDRSKTLTIDPVLEWATYYGGSGHENGHAVATDIFGNVYLAGQASSTNNIAFNGYQNNLGGDSGTDAYLVKFNEHGVRQWATYYGGSDVGTGIGRHVTTDKIGNVYLTGQTSSSANISFNGHQSNLGGGFDAFLVKFDNNGVRLWATYYGGSGNEIGFSITTDEEDNIYMAGVTRSPNNISFNGHQNNFGTGNDAFLVKFNADGVRQWATYYGGIQDDAARSVITDKYGNIYLAGHTGSTANISFNGHQGNLGGGFDAFLVKFNKNGVRLWATYYGGNQPEFGHAVATDLDDNVYMAGQTNSTNNIAFNGHQNNYGGNLEYDGFLVKFNKEGVRQWATYYGGNNNDLVYSLFTNIIGHVYIAGLTNSTNNIASEGYQNSYGGGQDAFLAKFNTHGVRLWARYYGGAMNESGYSVASDTMGNVYLAGRTVSTNNIAFNGHQNNYGGVQAGSGQDAFLAKFSSCLFDTTFSDSACSNYKWSVNNKTYTQSGTYTERVGGHAGCDSFVTLNLTLFKNHTDISFVEACSLYTWDVNNITYTQSGTYRDTFTSQNGCDSIHTLVLTIDTIPSNIELSVSPLQGCEPLKVNFDITPILSSQYYLTLKTGNGDSSIIKEDGQSTYLYQNHGKFTPQLLIRSIGGCDTLVIGEEVVVYPKPIAAFSFSPDTPRMDKPELVFNNLTSGANSFEWQIEGIGNLNDFEPIVFFDEAGRYKVRLIALSDKGCSDTAESEVYVRMLERMYMPTAFSPNGDGLNDLLVPTVSGLEVNEFSVYNRWGEKVFSSQGKGWDGKYNNAEAPTGVYTYTLILTDENGKRLLFTGTVSLMR